MEEHPSYLSGIPQATIDYFLQESREYLDILRKSINNLPIIITEYSKQQEIYRTTFCLRGALGVLGYCSPIAAYGLDECLQQLLEKPVLIDTTLITSFSELVELLTQTVELARTGIAPTSKEYEALMFRSNRTVKSLREYMNLLRE